MYSDYIEMDGSEGFPDDIRDERYVEIPHKNDLGLGKRLVLDFAASYLPDQFEDVERIFAKREAYRNFKELLLNRSMLEKWYDYENSAIKAAFLKWCAFEKIEFIE